MNNQKFTSIPILDMSTYLAGDAAQQQSFSQMLCETCHQVGFFYLQGHGISIALMKKILMLTKAFYDSPARDKRELDIMHSPHFRGYGKLQAETTLGIPDLKETYDLGIERYALDTCEKPYQILHGPNQWPITPSLVQEHFRETVLEYIDSMLQLGLHMMQALARGLGISSEKLTNGFDPYADDAFAMLRLLHYPTTSYTDQLGVGPHVDAGCLVFLLQDDVGGLQVQNHDGLWIDAPPLEDAFIVNIGEMLQLLSDHYFVATPHRVVNQRHQRRVSAPFFFEPNLSTIIQPIELPQALPRHERMRAFRQKQGVTYGEHMLNIYKRSFQNHG